MIPDLEKSRCGIVIANCIPMAGASVDALVLGWMILDAGNYRSDRLSDWAPIQSATLLSDRIPRRPRDRFSGLERCLEFGPSKSFFNSIDPIRPLRARNGAGSDRAVLLKCGIRSTGNFVVRRQDFLCFGRARSRDRVGAASERRVTSSKSCSKIVRRSLSLSNSLPVAKYRC